MCNKTALELPTTSFGGESGYFSLYDYSLAYKIGHNTESIFTETGLYFQGEDCSRLKVNLTAYSVIWAT